MQRTRLAILLGALASSTLVCERARETVPPQRDAAAIARGQQLFVDHCAICHGERADGHGTRSQFLDPRPRDLTSQQWQLTHPEESVTNSIRNGVAGTAMPSWRSLSEQQIRDLTAFVKSRSS
ncbi:MAG: c-type cytochrome [Thermoanaerobaculia bacterium]